MNEGRFCDRLGSSCRKIQSAVPSADDPGASFGRAFPKHTNATCAAVAIHTLIPPDSHGYRVASCSTRRRDCMGPRRKSCC